MNINNANFYYQVPNNQQTVQESTQIQNNIQESVQTEQNTQQNFDTVINNRIIDKIIKTRNLADTFSNNVLDKLIDKEFFIKEMGSWRNRCFYVFKNEQTGKQITADEDCAESLDTQVLSKLSEINSIELRINRLTDLNNQNNLNVVTSDFTFEWVSMVEKTINTLTKHGLDATSVDRAIAKGFYLDKIKDYIGNIVCYTFKCRNSNYTFCITGDSQINLTEQLNNELSKIQVRTTTNTVATTSSLENINTLAEEDISSIESYGYKIIVISRALANLSSENRILLLHDINNPYVDNLSLFKDLIIESIVHATNNSEQDKISYLKLMQDTPWSLLEINTIIRKGILLEN